MTALTPVKLLPDSLLALHAANPSRYPVLLESAVQGDSQQRYDILFACPRERLTLTSDGVVRLTGTDAAKFEVASSFLATLDRWWLREKVERHESEISFT
ncbi:MAG TPA: hypothetical protein VET48_03915, partial [Steroidobacteraceae bacterium]|nr:hypothetical protein [Steroidobacteraceae bacterium]